jgi:hypothetical protein
VSKLPGLPAIQVDDVKVRDYLLNPENPQNSGKAGLFTRFGFSRERWAELAESLGRHPVFNDVISTVSSSHGVKYVVQCALQTPDGRNPCLRSVWIVQPGRPGPRLVTAY